MMLCKLKCVGAIIRNNEGKILCLYRLRYGKGLALVSGHVENGETAVDAVIREVAEETSLRVTGFKKVFSGIVPGLCKRAPSSICELDFNISKVKPFGHEKTVFEITSYEGEPRLMEKDKHLFVQFMSVQEIYDCIASGYLCDPTWFTYVLPYLALSNLSSSA